MAIFNYYQPFHNEMYAPYIPALNQELVLSTGSYGDFDKLLQNRVKATKKVTAENYGKQI